MEDEESVKEWGALGTAMLPEEVFLTICDIINAATSTGLVRLPCAVCGGSHHTSRRLFRKEEEMPDTVGSSLVLSVIDLGVVFVVLLVLMAVCYGLSLFSRPSPAHTALDAGGDERVDAAAGDEPASESFMIHAAARRASPRAEGSAQVSAGAPAQAVVRTYHMSVDGVPYDVEVANVLDTAESVAPQNSAPRLVVEGAQQEPALAKESPRTSEVMKSPLPGRILKVLAAPGTVVARGDTLLTIEAMKMENEILAPCNCAVTEVFVAANQSVRTGDRLLTLE